MGGAVNFARKGCVFLHRVRGRSERSILPRKRNSNLMSYLFEMPSLGNIILNVLYRRGSLKKKKNEIPPPDH